MPVVEESNTQEKSTKFKREEGEFPSDMGF